jgi:hypothetical protein
MVAPTNCQLGYSENVCGLRYLFFTTNNCCNCESWFTYLRIPTLFLNYNRQFHITAILNYNRIWFYIRYIIGVTESKISNNRWEPFKHNVIKSTLRDYITRKITITAKFIYYSWVKGTFEICSLWALDYIDHDHYPVVLNLFNWRHTKN